MAEPASDWLTRPTMQERIRTLFEVHDQMLTHNPVQAHWNAAAVATAGGALLSVCRGAAAALTNPAGQRLRVFAFVTQGVAPLYIIPFVLGSQVDCYETVWERQHGRRKPIAELGGAADLG